MPLPPIRTIKLITSVECVSLLHSLLQNLPQLIHTTVYKRVVSYKGRFIDQYQLQILVPTYVI
jgi:hypothetical protein